MAKTSSSKVPAGPSTRKQYLKKRATKVTAKAPTYAKQYRSNLQTICKTVDGLTITPLHIVEMRKTPFGPLFEKIANKQIDYQMCKKSDVDVATLIKTFHKRTGSFRIGGKSFNLIDSDISIIFGIQDGLEDLVMPKSAPKPSTEFVIRRFPSDARLTVPIITSKLRQVATGTTPIDIEDFVRIICLILFVTMLLPTTGQSIGWGYLQLVDNYTEMARYNWSAAIHKTLVDSLHKNSDTPHKVTGCVIALLYWFCERTNLIQPVEAEAFPRFLRWNLQSLNKEMSADFHNKVSALQVNTCMPLEISEEERAIIEKNKNRASEEVHTTPPCETYETGQRELLATGDDVIVLRDESSDEVDEEVDEKSDEEDEEVDEVNEEDEEVIVSIQRLCDTILEEADRVSPSKVQEETENVEEEHLTKVNDVLGIVIQKLQSDKWSMNLEIIHRGEVIEQLRRELVEAEQTIRSKVVESSRKDDVIQLLNCQLANLDDINVEHVQKIDDLTTQLVAVLETEKLKNENSASTSQELPQPSNITIAQNEEKLRYQVELNKKLHQIIVQLEQDNASLQTINSDLNSEYRKGQSVVSGLESTVKRLTEGNKSLKDQLHSARDELRKADSRKRKADDVSNIVHDVDDIDIAEPTKKKSSPTFVISLKYPSAKLLSKEDYNRILHIQNLNPIGAIVWSGNEAERIIGLKDIGILLCDQELNNNIIDSFCEILYSQQMENSESKSFFFNSLSWTLITDPALATYRATQIDDLLNDAFNNHRYLHFPINSNGPKKGQAPYHWTLLVLDTKEGRWKHYNSMRPRDRRGDPWGRDARAVKLYVENIIKHSITAPDFGTTQATSDLPLIAVLDSPQQDPSSVDCGVIVCYLLMQITNGLPIPDKHTIQQVRQLRADMVSMFLNNPKSWTEEKFNEEQGLAKFRN